MAESTGYRSRDDLLAENRTLKAERADLQGKLKVANEGLEQSERARVAALENVDALTEALATAQGHHQAAEELLAASERVRIGCPESHPFKPEGGLTKGHVHLDKKGEVTVWCSRGHFDRWYQGE